MVNWVEFDGEKYVSLEDYKELEEICEEGLKARTLYRGEIKLLTKDLQHAIEQIKELIAADEKR